MSKPLSRAGAGTNLISDGKTPSSEPLSPLSDLRMVIAKNVLRHFEDVDVGMVLVLEKLRCRSGHLSGLSGAS